MAGVADDGDGLRGGDVEEGELGQARPDVEGAEGVGEEGVGGPESEATAHDEKDTRRQHMKDACRCGQGNGLATNRIEGYSRVLG